MPVRCVTSPSAAINEDTPTRATAVAMAKAASDDCQTLIGRESIQSFGGIGYTWEHDAHLYVKRATTDGALLRWGGAALVGRRRQPRCHLQLRHPGPAPSAPANR